MALFIQKYGGTSLADVQRIKSVARHCIAMQRAGKDVVVVIAAMSGEANRLHKLVSNFSDWPNKREQDVVVAAGEQIAVGLLALAIQAQGGQAVSFLPHQCGLITDGASSHARIRRIDGEKIADVLQKKQIVVISGFLGMDEAGNLTALGPNGADQTAGAIAAALQDEDCEIYSDREDLHPGSRSVAQGSGHLEIHPELDSARPSVVGAHLAPQKT